MLQTRSCKVWNIFNSQQLKWQFRELDTAQDQILHVYKRWLIVEDLK